MLGRHPGADLVMDPGQEVVGLPTLDRLPRRTDGHGALPRLPYALTLLRQDDVGRQRVPTIAVLDLALWNLIGKLKGEPVYRLLGGPTRERVRAYAGMLGFAMQIGWAEAERRRAQRPSRLPSTFRLTSLDGCLPSRVVFTILMCGASGGRFVSFQRKPRF